MTAGPYSLVFAMVGVGSGTLTAGVATVAHSPANWAPYITAGTGLILALTGLIGAIIALVKVFQNQGRTEATAATVATHQTKLDSIEASQARLLALTGTRGLSPPGGTDVPTLG